MTSINRSQSLLTTNGRVPVLTPAREERARLEVLLSDVWTKNCLPFPGMTGRGRGESLVRSSASSMIRKLSVASITSTFTKRSGSVKSANTKTESDGESGEGPKVQKERGCSSLSSQTWDSEESLRSRLPVIHDMSDCRGSVSELQHALASTRQCSEATGTVVRRKIPVPPVSLDAQWVDDGNAMGTPALRVSSARSFRSTATIHEKRIHLSAKENTKTSQRVSSKWIKAQVMPRGVVPHGIRSIFR